MAQEYLNSANSDRAKARSLLGEHRAILSLLKSDKKKQILDLGSGEGALSEKLISLGHDITACDGDPGQFKLNQVICQKVDLNKEIPFANSEFDIVILSDVIEHLENPWHIIREARRVLKPGGKVIISIPNILSIGARVHFLLHGEFLLFYLPKDNKPYPHITPLTYPLLEKILKSSDFKVSRILSNIPFIKECDEWERKNTEWYRKKEPNFFSIINIIGILIKFKVRISKYANKDISLLNDIFFYGDAIIIEALKE